VDALLKLGSAYQLVGHHRLATTAAQQALIAAEKSDHRTLAEAKNLLGTLSAASRSTEVAERWFNEALSDASEAKDDATAGSILVNLGILHAAQRQYPDALASFTRSAELAERNTNALLLALARVNQTKAATLAEQWSEAERACELAAQALEALEPVHEKATLLLSLSLTFLQWAGRDAARHAGWLPRANQLCMEAAEIARQIGDDRSLSYALGYRSQLSFLDGQFEAALHAARKAAFYAQRIRASEALFHWQWQAARAQRSMGQQSNAIADYRRAVAVLQSIRHDLVLALGREPEPRSFRDAFGPLFFELADLLLRQVDAETDSKRRQALLLETRSTLEMLKSAELEDYFQDDCVNIAQASVTSIDAVAEKTAVLYLVPLPDRTELLLSLSNRIERFEVPVSQEQLTQTVRDFRKKLEKRTTHEYRQPGRLLYDWLVTPVSAALTSNHVETMVFVPDGALRLVPMGALFDGEKFLVEHFAVAVAPGLTLMGPKSSPRGSGGLLLGGVSVPVRGLPTLEYVPQELRGVQALYGGTVLLDQEFRIGAIEAQFGKAAFSIVHFASHCEFDADIRKTFVLAYDGEINLDQLEALIRPSQYRGPPVELLVLSACQTAAGDDRAALGLAGLALKAGARSALATLWLVHDEAASILVSDFYAAMWRASDGAAGPPQRHIFASKRRVAPAAVSKAKALKSAQINLIQDSRYNHPAYWAPYIVIGNWL